jgi:hypothetical protein
MPLTTLPGWRTPDRVPEADLRTVELPRRRPGRSFSFKEATPVDQHRAEGPIIDSPIIDLTFTRTSVYFPSNQPVGPSQTGDCSSVLAILSSCFPLVNRPFPKWSNLTT